MPVCKNCGDEVDELIPKKVGSKVLRYCEDCHELLEQEGEIAEASESAVQQMMGFKGRR